MGTQALFTREAAHKYPLTFTWQNNESNSFSKITLPQTAFDKKKNDSKVNSESVEEH